MLKITQKRVNGSHFVTVTTPDREIDVLVKKGETSAEALTRAGIEKNDEAQRALKRAQLFTQAAAQVSAI